MKHYVEEGLVDCICAIKDLMFEQMHFLESV